MKKTLLLLLLLAFAAQPREAAAQARKMVFFEHFTQASCGPCASQNPAFQENIMESNKGSILHVAYHTSWPGRDPMYDYNKADVDNRVKYFVVTSVPHMIMMGTAFRGSPVGVSQDMVDQAAMELSPVRIRVTESSNGTTRHVAVKVSTLGPIPAPNLVLRTVVVESEINYASAPGSNGEKDFPNVFRKSVPDIGGAAFTPAPVGESVTLEYDYDLDPAAWDTSRIYLIAFLQSDATKEVINAASQYDPFVEMITFDETFKKGIPGSPVAFDAQIENFGEEMESYRISFETEQPGGWMVTFSVDGTTYDSEAEIDIPAGAVVPIQLQIEAASLPGVGNYSLLAQSLTDSELSPQRLQFNTISGVTDLVVNSDLGWGASECPIQDTKETEQYYLTGIEEAGSTTHASTTTSVFNRGMASGVLDEVNNIYYNAGWTFPSLSEANTQSFMNFLNAGGNMYIAGQDIGWETWDENGYGTAMTKAFYRSYLHTTYLADGGAANNQLTPEENDVLFGGVTASRIVNVYGKSSTGTPYFYPDELRPTATGSSIFYYNGNQSKSCAIRSASGDFKTVYFGIGMEMIGDADVRNNIMKLTYQWFNGIISSVEYDDAMLDLSLSQNYPNPVSGLTTIPFSGVNREVTLRIVDITGRVISTRAIAAGSRNVRINTSGLQSGMYYYQLFDAGKLIGSKVMQVLH